MNRESPATQRHALLQILRRATFSATIVVAACFPCAAFADEPRTQTSNEATTEVWYGWQTLLLDTTSVALLAGGFATNSSGGGTEFFYASAAAYAAGPFVHMAHGHNVKAFADVAFRLGLPLFFGFVGAAATAGRDPFAQLEGAALGALTGFGTASALDAAWLARETVSVEPAAATGSVAWSPRVAVIPHGGASVGVGGSF